MTRYETYQQQIRDACRDLSVKGWLSGTGGNVSIGMPNPTLSAGADGPLVRLFRGSGARGNSDGVGMCPVAGAERVAGSGATGRSAV